MPLSLAKQILRDVDAQRVLIVAIDYNDGSDEQTLRLAQDASWITDPDESPANTEFKPFLARGLSVEANLDSGGQLGGISDVDDGVIEISNMGGRYDAFSDYLVDGRTVKAWVVGMLGNGTRVRYTDVYDEPVFVGVGVDRPRRGNSTLRVAVRGSLYKMDRLINPRSFSPPCLEFPGTTLGCVDFGDNFDVSGSFTVEAWIYSTNPTTTGQGLFQKDTGAAGWGALLGTSASGGLRGYVREQSTVNSDSAASVVFQARWHHVALSVNTATGTRIVTLDGTAVVTTTLLTGSPAGNSASFKIGSGFSGRMSRLRLHTVAKTPTQIRNEMYLPWLGTEASLLGLPNLEEGEGDSTADSKSGSVIVGTLGPGVTWSGTSEWCGDALVGKQWPHVSGYAKDVPLIPIDTAKGIWAAANGNVIDIPVVKSNHVPMSLSTHYTLDLPRGLVYITGGTAGSYSADVVANIPFGGAAGFDGVDDLGAHTVTCPSGALTLEMLARPRSTAQTTRYFGGWRNGTSAGARFLVFDTFATNSLIFQVRNDAGTSFLARYFSLVQDRMVHIAGVLDPAVPEIRIVVEGVTQTRTAVTGTFNTALSSFVLARMPDASSNFNNVVLDEVGIWSVALTDEQLSAIMLTPTTSGTGLVRKWRFGEGAGSTATDSVAAGVMTLTGASWTHSRISHQDMLRGTLLGPAGYTAAEIDDTAAAAFQRALPGDAGHYVGDVPTSCRAFWDPLLKGVHSYLVPEVDGADLVMGQIALPTGTPDEGVDFDGEWSFPLNNRPDLDEDPPGAIPSLLVLQWGHNFSVLDRETMVNIATSDPATYAYATSEFSSLSEPTSSGQGGPRTFQTALLRREDARAELLRIRNFYSVARERIWFTFGKAGLVLRPHSELRQVFRNGDGTARLGMAAPGRCFRVLRLRKVQGRNGMRVEALGWA